MNLSRIVLQTVGCVLVSCLTGTLHADAELTGAQPAQWRVVFKTTPTTAATVSWNTVEPGESHQVLLREEGTDAVQAIDCQRNGQYTGREKDPEKKIRLHYHHARLTNLKPNTQYHVVMDSDGNRSPPFYFVTAPADDRPLAILFGGDSRSGHEARRQMNRLMARLATEQIAAERPPILALAHGGDMVVDGRRLDQWSRIMSDYEETTGSDGRLLPIIPARGNHDHGPLFNEVFDFPPKDPNYYAQNLGPQVRMITLNTEISTAGDQAEWLEAELAQSRPTHRWLLAMYHTPAFPAVKIPGPAYVSWVPLFEKFHVDMVCEADGHNIKRTPPIRNNRIDPTGVVYIGEGGLGVGQRSPKANRWYLNSPLAKVGMGHHVQLLTFTSTSLQYRVILLDGKVFDEHVLAPRVLESLPPWSDDSAATHEAMDEKSLTQRDQVAQEDPK